jgi:glycine cleavage system H protein
MVIPDHLQYTKEHLWIDAGKEKSKIGLSDYAQELLGTISFIELPAIGVKLAQNAKLTTIEGLKSIIDVNCPCDCTVIDVNRNLKDNPKLINTDPYREGWIAELSITADTLPKTMLSAEAYRDLIKA